MVSENKDIETKKAHAEVDAILAIHKDDTISHRYRRFAIVFTIIMMFGVIGLLVLTLV